MKEAEQPAALAKKYGLEPVPDCVLRLTALVSQQDADLDKVAAVISKDAGLTARLLRAANPRAHDESEYTVDTVEGALMRNGLGCALILAMGAPLTLAVVKTFQTMLAVRTEMVSPKSVDPIEGEHFLATIQFSGKAAGEVRVHMTLDTARWIAATLLGLAPSEPPDPEAVHDATGEFANIISGNLRSNLSDAGLSCVISAPAISRTTDFDARSVPGGSLERMAFQSDQHVLFVDLAVNPWGE